MYPKGLISTEAENLEYFQVEQNESYRAIDPKHVFGIDGIKNAKPRGHFDQSSEIMDGHYVDRSADLNIIRPNVFRVSSLNSSKFERKFSIAHSIWDGEVIDINEDEFSAILRKKDGNLGDQIEVTFPKSDLTETDKKSIRVGTLFLYSITREIDLQQVSTKTKILLKRFPRLNRSSLKLQNIKDNDFVKFFAEE